MDEKQKTLVLDAIEHYLDGIYHGEIEGNDQDIEDLETARDYIKKQL